MQRNDVLFLPFFTRAPQITISSLPSDNSCPLCYSTCATTSFLSTETQKAILCYGHLLPDFACLAMPRMWLFIYTCVRVAPTWEIEKIAVTHEEIIYDTEITFWLNIQVHAPTSTEIIRGQIYFSFARILRPTTHVAFHTLCSRKKTNLLQRNR